MTAVNDKATHQELISAGATACLTKPAQTKELADIAKTLLKESKYHYSQALVG